MLLNFNQTRCDTLSGNLRADGELSDAFRRFIHGKRFVNATKLFGYEYLFLLTCRPPRPRVERLDLIIRCKFSFCHIRAVVSCSLGTQIYTMLKNKNM